MSSLPEGVTVRDYLEARFPALAEATATESIIFSSSGSSEPQLPAYDEDRPPPKYRAMEELAVENEEEEQTLAQQKRVLIIRLLAGFFCLVVVGLVVAAAVVHNHYLKTKKLQQQQGGNGTSSELRGPTVDEGLVVALTVAVFAVASAEPAATTAAVPFTA
ncbi:hypothetical protein TgHK011_002119 [Trichoderma gracile]|nr:hypothetical protein TgHK011_002119 [Trichoderma gracile]